MKKGYQQGALEALISASALRECRAVRVEAGWAIEARIGLRWLPVRSRREPVRVWSSLTAVERFCTRAGIKQLLVEL
ncbi:hypothetical protein D3C86_1788640 [compost metagenome]